MGALFGSKSPTPLPPPARPVTAVTKTPTLDLDGPELEETKERQKKKKGKRSLRTDMGPTSVGRNTTKTGLQIPDPDDRAEGF